MIAFIALALLAFAPPVEREVIFDRSRGDRLELTDPQVVHIIRAAGRMAAK